MHKQIVVGIEDLRFAALLCGHCGTRVTIDLAVELQQPQSRPQFATPRECPRCHTSFDSAVAPAIDAMQKVYKALAELHAVSFTADESPAPPAPSR